MIHLTEDQEAVLRALASADRPAREYAEAIGCGVRTTRNLLKRRGIPFRSVSADWTITDRRCPICGHFIPDKRGVPMKTCSPECQSERKRRIERARNTREGVTPGAIEPVAQ